VSSNVPEGFQTLEGLSPAEDSIGPFYYRKTDSGLALGFRASPDNCNGLGTVHGGILMTFADYVVTMLALSGVRENCATVSFSSHFIAAAHSGDWIAGAGEVVKRTGSMTFVSGQLSVAEEPVLTFQAAVKRLKKPG
jgi:acyl-coenzyme A thioesterase PaaI-like protein